MPTSRVCCFLYRVYLEFSLLYTHDAIRFTSYNDQPDDDPSGFIFIVNDFGLRFASIRIVFFTSMFVLGAWVYLCMYVCMSVRTYVVCLGLGHTRVLPFLTFNDTLQ